MTDLARVAADGVAAWQGGDAAGARRAFETIVAAGRATPQLWLLLAQACVALGDAAAAHGALDQVLASDGRNLFALLLKGDLLTQAADARAASAFYTLALQNAPPRPADADLEARLVRAEAGLAAQAAGFAAHLDAALADVPRPPRFAEALDIMQGRAGVQLQQPTSFYYPGLPQTAFYDPAAFDWVAGLEAAVPTMQAELAAVLDDPDGLVPYVKAPPGRPNRGHALLNDPRWSAYHLWEDGAAVAAHAARCPATMTALAGAPMPRIAARSPMALFSVLRPRTHIPPHHGMLNTRLICHIPLLVPDGCRLRVGNHVRHVEAGRAMIFDDSIEHEAWNDSDATRVVLLFEIWRPELGAAERTALTMMFEAIGGYPAG